MRERQLRLEREMVTRGRDRYWTARSRDIERGREYDHPVVGRIMGSAMEDLLPVVRRLQNRAKQRIELALNQGTRLGGWEAPIAVLDAKTLGYIALKTAIVSAGEEHTIQRCATTAGGAVSLEIMWSRARHQEARKAKEREYDPPNRIQLLKRTVKQINPKSVRKWLRRLDDLELNQLNRKDAYQTGAALLSTILEACPDLVQRKTITRRLFGRPTSVTVLVHTPELSDAISQGHLEEALATPWLLPMVAPPRSWTEYGEGGYYAIPLPVVKRSGRYRHKLVPSAMTLKALNLVQGTAWRINRRVFEVSQQCHKQGAGPLPYEPTRQLPQPIPTSQWETMTREERGAHKALRESVHSHNAKTESQRQAHARTLAVAEEFLNEPSIWFPHNLDWRGRMYPASQDLHPQANDATRGLLQFSEGKPLGQHGLRWLMYQAANCWGLDKVDRMTQETWCWLHRDDLEKLAENPLGHLTWWQQAEEPWQLLAVAQELTEALQCNNPAEFVSHLPVHIDGSCNGLQHLSAMGLDPVGADAVNLTPGPRKDIYGIVAHKVSQLAWSTVWADRISRRVVKRGVMTTPYGVTKVGMREQLIADGWLDGVPGDRLKNANILRDMMLAAIGDTLVVGTQIMRWLQDCAGELASQFNRGITWETPCGNMVTQSYEEAALVQVSSLLGRLRFRDELSRKRPRVKPQKARLSVAPNIIHSYDASHLVMTVAAMGPEYSYAMVHDSFGVHACDVDVLGQVTRQSFVDIYSRDQFAALQASFIMEQPVAVSRVLEELKPPERGTLDIQQVLESEYFFS